MRPWQQTPGGIGGNNNNVIIVLSFKKKYSAFSYCPVIKITDCIFNLFEKTHVILRELFKIFGSSRFTSTFNGKMVDVVIEISAWFRLKNKCFSKMVGYLFPQWEIFIKSVKLVLLLRSKRFQNSAIFKIFAIAMIFF